MNSRIVTKGYLRKNNAGISRSIAAMLVLVAPMTSCQQPAATDRPGNPVNAESDRYVAALGNVRGNKAPSQTETRLAEFLFGAEPESPLGLIKPTSIAVKAGEMFICDPAQSAVFGFDCATGEMKSYRADSDFKRPNAIAPAGDGQWLICDVGLGAVLRVDERGTEKQRYTVSEGPFRPADAVRVEQEIWVTNTPLHRVEVFDFESGVHKRSIGHRGSKLGEFGFPLGMARGPDGRVYVADSLNQRVQVFDPDGTSRGTIGKPGDRVGSFGRPKDVAVAADGTVFVVDAASQRVHAFDRSGKPITAFGEPRGGKNELCIPAGIEVSTSYPGDHSALPDGFIPNCYVFVAEQLRAPGIRVFAWRGARDETRPTFPPRAGAGEIRRVSSVPNPHWSADRCTTCHAMSEGRLVAIDPKVVDDNCLACHDGVKAHAEAHPIGRNGHTAFANVPADWPLNQDRLSCLTCHDIQRHCDANAARPDRNAVMLRGPEVERPLDFCTNCHTPSEQWRINPHRQLAADGSMRAETCGFCHTGAIIRTTDGLRTHESALRAAGSGICLSCHAPHWDYFPEGHIDRPVTDEIRRRLIAREFAPSLDSGASPENAGFLAAIKDPNHQTAILPLAGNKVACYSCHNPHEPGLFPADSPLGTAASSGESARVFLRMEQLTLCQTCHSK